MTELGKIDKLDVASLKNKKMIYFVRNLYLPQDATEGYKGIFNRYWDQVEEHLSKLETAGKISKIFCESIYMSGEDSMKVLKAMNERLELEESFFRWRARKYSGPISIGTTASCLSGHPVYMKGLPSF
jgi:hypothetical protein